eukprot:TRINITY_DN3362_c0_g1_i3.p1 TRINITY_DN3362_c0_g1~~TRINITY_DN3362_c0_g1_i3.p1  ORF type:complete len:302 (-),score=42.11 TRINITY_DN3362_c0_g1_i3:156-1061(-)
MASTVSMSVASGGNLRAGQAWHKEKIGTKNCCRASISSGWSGGGKRTVLLGKSKREDSLSLMKGVDLAAKSRVSAALSVPEAVAVYLLQPVGAAFSTQSPSWSSALVVNLTVFLLGAPILLSGLTWSGMAAAFFLGTVTSRAFGTAGFTILCLYFVLGTAVTKVRMKQKTAEGIAEKRSGRRGPGSVWGSGSAGIVWGLAAALSGPSVVNVEGLRFLELAFVASFCTKISDTSASEIGKAYGQTTYLVTTLERVPRGTEGAVSLEGTLAGLVAACLMAAFAQATDLVLAALMQIDLDPSRC